MPDAACNLQPWTVPLDTDITGGIRDLCGHEKSTYLLQAILARLLRHAVLPLDVMASIWTSESSCAVGHKYYQIPLTPEVSPCLIVLANGPPKQIPPK